MERSEFKQRMQSLKSYREQNPGKGYWDWRVEAFQDGGTKIGTTRTDYYGNQTHYLPVSLQDNTLDIGLPEITVTPRNNLNLASAVTEGMNQVGRDLVEASTYVTPLGDAEEVYNIGKDFYGGNYGQAFMGLGLFALPGSIGKLYRKAKNFSRKGSVIRSQPDILDIEQNARILTITNKNSGFNFRDVDNQNLTFFNEDVKKQYQNSQNNIIQNNRRLIKTFNKWNRHYGYPPIDLNLDKTPKLAEQAIRDRLKEHNTFVRGVRDVYGDKRDDINRILIGKGIEPTEENRLKYFATTYAPNTGAGRSGFSPKYQNEGALYTSNSLNTAAGYAYNRSADKLRGAVVKVRRPVQYYDDLAEQILNSDFEFDTERIGSTNPTYVRYELPYLLRTGRSLKLDIIKEKSIPKISLEQYTNFVKYAENQFPLFSIKTDIEELGYNDNLSQLLDRLRDKGLDTKYVEHLKYRKGAKFNNNITTDIEQRLRDLLYRLDYGDIDINYANQRIGYLGSRKYRESMFNQRKQRIQELINGQIKRFYANNARVTEEDMQNFLRKNNISVNNSSTNVITTETFKRTSRNVGSPYQHFIFTGPIGEKALDFVDFIDSKEFNDLYKTRQHIGDYYSGLSRKSYSDGGEVPPDNSPVHVNPITNRPLANGAIQPIFNLEDAASLTPVGDIMSIRDAYIAAQNNDILGLGLAGLGVIPFIPRVNRNHFVERFAEMERRDAKKHEALDEFFRQRNSVYESLIENEEAYRKAANADRVSKSNYRQTYGDIIRAYSNDAGNYNPNLTQPAFRGNLDGTQTKAQVDPSNLGYIYLNPRYADPNELDDAFRAINPGLVRHELGHEIDVRSGLDYTNKLSDPEKFVSDEKLKEMYPKTHQQFKNNVLNRGSEIKSYMNEFRDYLINKGMWNERETIHTFRNKLDKYSKDFPVLRRIFDSYKSKRQFVEDYNTVPIAVNNQNITIS